MVACTSVLSKFQEDTACPICHTSKGCTICGLHQGKPWAPTTAMLMCTILDSPLAPCTVCCTAPAPGEGQDVAARRGRGRSLEPHLLMKQEGEESWSRSPGAHRPPVGQPCFKSYSFNPKILDLSLVLSFRQRLNLNSEFSEAVHLAVQFYLMSEQQEEETRSR